VKREGPALSPAPAKIQWRAVVLQVQEPSE
jgi:hypothetical protein